MGAVSAARSCSTFLGRLRRVVFVCCLSMVACIPLSMAFTGDGPALDHRRLDRPLTGAEVTRYRTIFDLQAKGQWNAADTVIAELEDQTLLGHVLAQRYLHPTGYKATYRELAAWLARYADHPHAKRLYRLALKRKPKAEARPRRPIVAKNSLTASRYFNSGIERPSTKKLTKSQRRQAVRLKRQVRRNLRRVYLTKTERLLDRPEAQRLLDQVELDEAYSELAAGWYYHGEVEKAFRLAGEVAARSGTEVPLSYWTAGLAAWRLGQIPVATRHFELLAVSDRVSGWNRAAGSYWAARAHLAMGDLARAQGWLAIAAEHPRTFYGLLARYKLGLRSKLSFRAPALGRSELDRLLAIAGGIRALALLQVDRNEHAEQELLRLDGWNTPGIREAILSLAETAGLAQLSLQIAQRSVNGDDPTTVPGQLDAALYPVPTWSPREGFVLDRALIFAFMRQESSFDPRAKSPDGARGLMQLMPRTAAALDKKRSYKGRQREALYDPALNIGLGQRYLRRLLGSRAVANNLLRLAVAYNAGPGNLGKWERRMSHGDDPLLFIESLPTLETRLFVERVLTNLWIYRQRFGQTAPSLYALASDRWPGYRPMDRQPQQIAARPTSAPNTP